MMVNPIHKADTEIISLLKAGTYKGWEHLYNKYAPVMYGTIMRAVGFNKIIANEMLEISFLELKNNNFFAAARAQSLGLYLVQHCYQLISNHRKAAQFIGKGDPYLPEPFPLLQAAIKHKQPLRLIAAKIGITEALAMARLRSELKEARTKFALKDYVNTKLPRNNTGDISSQSS